VPFIIPLAGDNLASAGGFYSVLPRRLAFGRDGDRFYCLFSMPFRAGARLEHASARGADGRSPANATIT
jgi:hypothetical protein